MVRAKQVLRRRALRVDQNKKHPLYLLSLTGDELMQIADISRVSRDEAGKLLGYQRPEVKRHVKDIVDYLNDSEVLFPNSLIVSLSSSVRFIKSRGPQVDDGHSISGTLEIRLPKGNESKPAWIVDGQQRALAISKSNRRDLPIPVNAFIADEVDLQRDQFLRINNTKPLPRGLITELLPEVATTLPAKLAQRKVPAALCDLLNRQKDSPFYGMIRRSSTTQSERKKCVVTDTSLVKMLQESLSSPTGVLFPWRNIATGETDYDGIWAVLVTYWTAVRRVFKEDWGKPATKSRLLHGAGIRAMGRLMDRVMASIDPLDRNAVTRAAKELRKIKPICRWSFGVWEDLDDMSWNAIQNVPAHIRLLSNLLIRAYVNAGTRGR